MGMAGMLDMAEHHTIVTYALTAKSAVEALSKT
jgi:hypothetical protein